MLQIGKEDLGTIRFTTVPRDGSPPHIREQWIGVEVPCVFLHDGVSNQGDSTHDMESGLEVPICPGYIVLQTHAIEALQQKSPEAAMYWIERGFPNHMFALFLFALDSAEILKPVPTREEFFMRFVEV